MTQRHENVSRAEKELHELTRAMKDLSGEHLICNATDNILTFEVDNGDRYIVESQPQKQRIRVKTMGETWPFEWSTADRAFKSKTAGLELWDTLYHMLARGLNPHELDEVMKRPENLAAPD